MFKTRHADENDIEQLLEIEFDRYKTLYEELPHKRREVEERFRKRIKIARSWMWVLEQDGKVTGFITGQPTNQEPEDFESWEQSTNNGTLEGKFFPEGKNVYVVNLDARREATKKGGQYLLMAMLGAKAIRQAKEKVIFESRMPGFRDWVKEENKPWDKLNNQGRQRLAEEYASLTAMINGREVLHDRLLRFYENGGFTFVKVYANAFEDVESLNFGVLCVGYNPVPKSLRLAPVNILVSAAFRLIGKNQKLFEKFVG